MNLISTFHKAYNAKLNKINSFMILLKNVMLIILMKNKIVLKRIKIHKKKKRKNKINKMKNQKVKMHKKKKKKNKIHKTKNNHKV